MGRRVDLHEILVGALGSRNVYFQPPPNVQMKYPAIVYNRDYAVSEFADNNTYRYTTRYELIHIDRNPDSEVISKLAHLPLCTYVRFYAADDLNHDVFNLYF